MSSSYVKQIHFKHSMMASEQLRALDLLHKIVVLPIVRQKLHRVILRSPLLRIHYYHNKWLQVKKSQYFIPTYSWTLTPIPNWTCSVMTISHFQYTAPSTWFTNCADPSTRLKHQLKKMLATKFFNSSKRWRPRSSLVTKSYGVQTQQLLQEKDELGQILSPVTICMNKTLLYTCATFDSN